MPLIGIVVGCRNNKVTKKYFTLTTVGYGDIYPITIGGKIFTFIILIIGLGIIAVPTGLFTSALSKTRKQD